MCVLFTYIRKVHTLFRYIIENLWYFCMLFLIDNAESNHHKP